MRVSISIGIASALALAVAPLAKAQGPSPAPQSQAKRNLADFDFVTSKIASNYAGWDTKVTKETKPKLDELTARLRAKAATASDEQLLAMPRSGWSGSTSPLNHSTSAAPVPI